MSEIFEAGMVIMFGISWPISILKSIKSGTAKGKSLLFMIFIWVGYVFGIINKFATDKITYVLFFYFMNLIMVTIDISLYFINTKKDMNPENSIIDSQIKQNPDALYKAARYRHLNKHARKKGIVLAGSSLCELFPIDELLQSFSLDYLVYNRGIGGTTIQEYASFHEDCIFELEPSKLFLHIGSNDLDAEDYTVESHREKLSAFIISVKERMPDIRLYLLAYYPVTEDLSLIEPGHKTRTNRQITEANQMIEELAEHFSATYVNLNDVLLQSDGKLRTDFASDYMHMWPNAYVAILNRLLLFFDE